MENKEKPYSCPEEINCEYLRNRELFITYVLEDNIVTIIYKNLTTSISNDFKWIKSSGGNCYRYENRLFNNKCSYILKDSNNNPICGMKMVKEDAAIKSLFFDLIISSI